MQIDELRGLRENVVNSRYNLGWRLRAELLCQRLGGLKPSAATSEIMYNKELVKTEKYCSTMIPTPLRLSCFLKLFEDLAAYQSVVAPSDDAKDFCKVMTAEKGDDKRVHKMLPILQQLLRYEGTLVNSECIVTQENNHGSLTDPDHQGVMFPQLDAFTSLRGLGVLLTAIEIKNESHSASKSESHAQGEAYILRWMMDRVNEVVNNYPVLVVSFTGCTMVVRAVVYSDPESDRLSDTKLFSMEIGSDNASEVTWVFQALRECISSLVSYAVNSFDSARKITSDFTFFEQYRYPWLREVVTLSGVLLKFQYYFPIVTKNVFVADVAADSACQPVNKNLIVKFFRGAYCAGAHHLLAAHGYAPVLYAVLNLQYGDWSAVVMERVRRVNFSNLLPHEKQLYRESEKSAIDCLHGLGLVHGDLRNQNLCYTVDGRVKIIDFDWCGPVGTARYPTTINMAAGIPWHGTVGPGELIEKDHDWHFFNERYLEQLGAAETAGSEESAPVSVDSIAEGVDDIALV